jgi:hypothetical protein
MSPKPLLASILMKQQTLKEGDHVEVFVAGERTRALPRRNSCWSASA